MSDVTGRHKIDNIYTQKEHTEAYKCSCMKIRCIGTCFGPFPHQKHLPSTSCTWITYSRGTLNTTTHHCALVSSVSDSWATEVQHWPDSLHQPHMPHQEHCEPGLTPWRLTHANTDPYSYKVTYKKKLHSIVDLSSHECTSREIWLWVNLAWWVLYTENLQNHKLSKLGRKEGHWYNNGDLLGTVQYMYC